MENLSCMTFSGTGLSEVLAGGAQKSVLLLNVDRGSIVKQEPTAEWYTKLRKGRVICGATINGNIAIIDPRVSLSPQSGVTAAHTGAIEDIDTQDNSVLTCGWTYKYLTSCSNLTN
jgi:PAB-dependent poly(A)-specific ribonuclease subunit 2